MKTRSKWLILLVPALALFAMVACGAPAAQEPEASAPSAAPETMAPRGSAMEPPPLADFNDQQTSVNEAWDSVHAEFDQWRAGLAMCHPTTMTEALSGLAIEFGDVTEEARDLTRTKTTGEFADKLIIAAENEEAAFRHLRDRWQPGNVSLFENVEQQRNMAAQAQREAQDMSIALRAALEESADPEEIDEFTDGLQSIEEDWEAVNAEYKKVSGGADEEDVPAVVSGLKGVNTKMEDLIDAIDELPSLKPAREATKAVEKAAKAQAEAISAAIDEAGTGDDAKVPSFDDADASLKASEEALDSLSDVLEDLSVEDTADALADITQFDLEYARLLQTWDRFHSVYNDWRADDGGCDRLDVLESLTQFSADVDAVGDGVRSLPKSGYLEPAHRLLVAAIEGEEDAFRSLRDTWQPFTLDALRAVDRARTMSDARRSEADIIIQELENRF